MRYWRANRSLSCLVSALLLSSVCPVLFWSFFCLSVGLSVSVGVPCLCGIFFFNIDDMNGTSFTVQNCAVRINPTQNGGHTRPHATTAPGHQLPVHPSCPTETWQRIALQHTPRWNTISASTPVPSIAGSLAAPSWHGLSPTVPRKTLLQRTTCLRPLLALPRLEQCHPVSVGGSSSGLPISSDT